MLTSERLRELFSYSPDTGLFTRLVTVRGNGSRAGSVAGYVGPLGYVCIGVDLSTYLAHRLAWLYAYGVWPAGMLDHRDRNRANNRITNLRIVTQSENQQNRQAASRNSESGLLGACFGRSAQRWLAAITINGRTHYLGRFHTPEEASAAYREAKARLHPSFVAAPA